jgi:two-component system response regulator DevR
MSDFPMAVGMEVCRRPQQMDLDTKVPVLTSYAADDLVFDAIAAGADGYLLKEIHGDKLIQAIQDVAAGKSILGSGRHPSRYESFTRPIFVNRAE